MMKRYATLPVVISYLNVKIPRSSPRQTSSGDTVLSKDITLQAIKRWEDTATSSKQPHIIKRKTPKGGTVLVQEINRDAMMFPEYNLKEYYWTEKDELKRLERPISKGIREERLERGRGSIHYANFNPIKRVVKVDEQKMGADGMGGHYLENSYTLLRQDGTEQKITDGDLADQLHPLDILFLKNHYEAERGNI
ncbi:hypothetical protein Hanom_Chr17g01579401 [Helianthus anomalus]